jgi:hypothetical protein
VITALKKSTYTSGTLREVNAPSTADSIDIDEDDDSFCNVVQVETPHKNTAETSMIVSPLQW